MPKERGNTSKRAAPMMLDYLNIMSTYILSHIELFIKDRAEVLYVLTAGTIEFYLWMRIDESFNMKYKDLELDIEHSDRKEYFYYKATFFQRKNDKKRNKRKPCTYEVHCLSEIERGACVKTFLSR